MSDPIKGPPPVDVPADPTDRAGAEATREAERANLEAAINRFNVNYNPNGGPPPRSVAKIDIS